MLPQRADNVGENLLSSLLVALTVPFGVGVFAEVADDETFFKRLEKEFDFFSSTLCFLAGEALADASS